MNDKLIALRKVLRAGRGGQLKEKAALKLAEEYGFTVHAFKYSRGNGLLIPEAEGKTQIAKYKEEQAQRKATAQLELPNTATIPAVEEINRTLACVIRQANNLADRLTFLEAQLGIHAHQPSILPTGQN